MMRATLMKYQRHNKNNGDITIRVVCAVVFLLFTFCWLFFFQADMLAVAQHGLSHGVTHYNRIVGAIIITAVLFLVHLLVFALIRLSRRTHALTYLPSFLLLAFVSGLSSPFSWGAWLWAAPLVLLAWGGLVVLARKVMPFGADAHQPTGIFSRRSWMNLLQMAAMMAAVAAVTNTNAIDHYKAHVEVALEQGRVDDALRTGERSLETDASLTMLRVFALSQKGQLADRLFAYALTGTSNDLLPLAGSKSHLLLLPDSVLWKHFGVSPDSILAGRRPTVAQYLDSLEHDTLATTAWRDYRLAAMLIDRRLDDFAAALPRYYTIDADSLPVHYREALVLYGQQRDTLLCPDSAMLERWHEYARYDTLYQRESERRIRREEDFRSTFWYYYSLNKH